MTVLDAIIEGVRADLAAQQKLCTLADLQALAAKQLPAREVLSAFSRGNFSVIAEVKRQSPSKGELAEIADPAQLAQAYAAGGAGAISVLTEQRRFGGSLADLEAVRAAVSTPLLRKDFIIDSFQVWQARAAGADLVLLIVAALTDPELIGLQTLIEELGMTALVEVHDEEEIQRALEVNSKLIGVNNRSLKTLEVDLNRFAELSRLIPDELPKIAESGIFTLEDVQFAIDHGATGILVGEALVKHPNPTQRVAEFAALGRPNQSK